MWKKLILLLCVFSLVGVCLNTPIIAHAQQTGTLNVYPLLDGNQDGHAEGGAPVGTVVEVYGPLGGNGTDYTLTLDNTIPVVSFENLPYGTYIIDFRTQTTFSDWKCNTTRGLDEPVEDVIVYCERVGVGLWGLFLPLLSASPLLQTAEHEDDHKLFIPQVVQPE